MPVFLVLGFGLSELLHYLQFEPLLTFLTAGFLVQNLTNQGEKLLHAVEKTGSVVYVVFFATAGAHLDIPLLRALWPVALTLSGRSRALQWPDRRRALASRLANDPPVLRAWGWSSLVSQAYALARTVSRRGARVLVVQTVAVERSGGADPAFKFALERAGEASKAAEPALESHVGA